MRLYEDIIRNRKNPDYRNGLLELESRRRYGERQEHLRRDITILEANIRDLNDKLSRLGPGPADDGDLEALKNKLRQLLMTMRQYAETKYTVTNEVAIYDKLLTYEESRLRSQSMSSQVKYFNNIGLKNI